MSLQTMRVSLRLARIKGYRESGLTVGQHDVDWLVSRHEQLSGQLEASRDQHGYLVSASAFDEVCADRDALAAQLAAAVETMRGIAGATSRAWEVEPHEFVKEFLPWSQSRCRHFLAKIDAKAEGGA